jgi:hypothetical protein
MAIFHLNPWTYSIAKADRTRVHDERLGRIIETFFKGKQTHLKIVALDLVEAFQRHNPSQVKQRK